MTAYLSISLSNVLLILPFFFNLLSMDFLEKAQSKFPLSS